MSQQITLPCDSFLLACSAHKTYENAKRSGGKNVFFSFQLISSKHVYVKPNKCKVEIGTEKQRQTPECRGGQHDKYTYVYFECQTHK